MKWLQSLRQILSTELARSWSKSSDNFFIFLCYHHCFAIWASECWSGTAELTILQDQLYEWSSLAFNAVRLSNNICGMLYMLLYGLKVVGWCSITIIYINWLNESHRLELMCYKRCNVNLHVFLSHWVLCLNDSTAFTIHVSTFHKIIRPIMCTNLHWSGSQIQATLSCSIMHRNDCDPW